MNFPLSGTEILLWLGITALLLFATSEFASYINERSQLLIDKRRLKRIALLFNILFLVDALFNIYPFFT